MVEEQQPKTDWSWLKWVVIPLVILISVSGLLFFNKTTEKCAFGNYSNGYCVTEINQSVLQLAELNNEIICEGELKDNVCKVDAKGILENQTIWIVLFIITGVIIIVYLFIKYLKKPTIDLELSEYKNYNPEEAKKSVERYFVKNKSFNIPHQIHKSKIIFQKEKEEVSYPENTFEWYDQHQPFIKNNGEWFFQAQVNISNSILSGIYTVLISLARNLEEIEGGLFRWGNSLFEYYKLDEMQKPYYQPKTERQKIYERLIALNRDDLLTQYAEKEAESLVNRVGSDKIPSHNPQIPIQQPIIQQPTPYYPRRYAPYNRNYRRY